MRSISLVSVNVYYSPTSFGGATIVAEEINKRLSSSGKYDITVITTHRDGKFHPYHIKKYKSKNVNIISINIPNHLTYKEQYSNENIDLIIEQIIDSIRPQVVHVHSIQTIGASFFRSVKSNNCKLILTIHDCWWICDRQFMINSSGKYCFQDKIDPLVCMYCQNDFQKAENKYKFLSDMKAHVDLFLFPSQFHLDLHLNNGFDPLKCRINKNGVKFPTENYSKSISPITRFGFTGGPGPIKGLDLIIEALGLIERSDYELVLVDGAKNLGKSWSTGLNSGSIKGKKTILPAYNQDTIDGYFKNIDVLLFPSQWKESFGLTVREALCRDIWVISTNGGGTIEDLRDMENSNIIPISNNPHELSQKINSCINRNWQSYKNVYKDEITSYDDQARSLDHIVTSLVN